MKRQIDLELESKFEEIRHAFKMLNPDTLDAIEALIVSISAALTDGRISIIEALSLSTLLIKLVKTL